VTDKRNDGWNDPRRRETSAEPATQPGRRVEVARRTGRGQLLSAHQAQSEPVPGHYGRAIVYGVPVPRTVRRRPGGVPTDRPILAGARHVRTTRARVRRGHEQMYMVVVPRRLHVGHNEVPSDHSELFADAVQTIRTGTKPKSLYL